MVGPGGGDGNGYRSTRPGSGRLNPESDGALFWDERNLSKDEDFSPSEIGYVPQFSIAYEALTVEENIRAVLELTEGSKQKREAKLRELGDAFSKLAKETGCEFAGTFGIVPETSMTKDGVRLPQELLRYVWQTDNRLTLPMSGTGSAARRRDEPFR